MVDDLREKEEAAEEALKSLEHMAVTDGLTQILNRKNITEALEKEIYIASNYHSNLSILLFDIDFFKKVNDQFGHLAGDQVLVDISRNIQSSLRKSDYFGRYGGEEFLVVMPKTDLETAYIIANLIREKIEKSDPKIKNPQPGSPWLRILYFYIFNNFRFALRNKPVNNDKPGSSQVLFSP
jgi:diguanylate cyclase (GGDEF)-like protein